MGPDIVSANLLHNGHQAESEMTAVEASELLNTVASESLVVISLTSPSSGGAAAV